MNGWGHTRKLHFLGLDWQAAPDFFDCGLAAELRSMLQVIRRLQMEWMDDDYENPDDDAAVL